MEVILYELQKNEINIDMETLSYHINECLHRYKSAFQSLPIPTESFDLAILFHKIGVINFGRAIAFLTFVYLLKESEEVMRNAVQLVAPLLKTLNLRKYKIVFFHKLISHVKGLFML